MLAQLIEGALAVLPNAVPNMLAVLGAALASVLLVSFLEDRPRFSQISTR
jgi:hypothetical protein